MTLGHIYRRVRRGLGLAILAAIVLVLALRWGLVDEGIAPLITGLVVVGAVASSLIVLRARENLRLDLTLLFLAGSTSAAVLGSGDIPSIAVPFGVVAVLLALLGCVAVTLLLGERSLNEPRSRF